MAKSSTLMANLSAGSTRRVLSCKPGDYFGAFGLRLDWVGIKGEVGEREQEIGAGKAATSLDAGEMLGCHLIPGSLLQGWHESGKAWQGSRFLSQRKGVGTDQNIVQVLLQRQKWTELQWRWRAALLAVRGRCIADMNMPGPWAFS